MKNCLVIPVYNHHQAIVKMLSRLKAQKLTCFLVNDGSSAECSAALKTIAAKEEWVVLHERRQNGGKGAAVIDGLTLAIKAGFSHAIQIDADGQHCLDDIAQFIHASQQHPDKLILGSPIYGDDVPKKRVYGRQLTNIWIWINTLSLAINDGMCGFRCYPLSAVDRLLSTVRLGQRMDFDIEIVVRLYWQGVDVVNIKTPIDYPLDGVSHFNMLHDNILISKKHAQLFFAMLIRFPRLVLRHF